MTCIVGLIDRRNSKVVMGGDSAGVSGLDISVRKDVKVFKVGRFVMGGTSSFRMIQLLRFSFIPPPVRKDVDLYQYMCTDFVNAIRDCFKKGGFAEKSDEAESGGEFLIGYEDRLFKIDSDYQVAEHYDDFIACGCGESYAVGSLYTQSKGVDPIKRITKALETATHFSAGVRPPFIIETT